MLTAKSPHKEGEKKVFLGVIDYLFGGDRTLMVALGGGGGGGGGGCGEKGCSL